jgi:hypothetical protein
MAKNAGRLAGLAALAGAAYMMTRGKDKEGPSAATTEKKVEAKDESFKPTGGSAYTGTTKNSPVNIGFGGGDDSDKNLKRVTPAPAAAAAASPAPVVTSTPPVQVNRTMEDATRQKVLDTLNQRAGANTPSALRSDQLADVSRAVKREDKTKKAAQGDFSNVTRNYKDFPAQVQKNYDTLNQKSGANTSSARKTDALMVASRAAKAADAKRRAAKQSSFKSGGMVSKVSSASSRADGIASRGKTKCKMY